MRICGRSASAIALTMSTLLSSMPAQAHNAPVHSDMVELSYEVMLAVENKTFNFAPPPGVAPAEWTAFLDSVAAAPAKYRLQQSQLPAPARDTCLFPVSGNNFDPGAGWSQTTMGAVMHPVASTYSHLNADEANDFSVRNLSQIADVVQITGNAWHGVSTAGVTAEWTAEAAEVADASPTFSQPLRASTRTLATSPAR